MKNGLFPRLLLLIFVFSLAGCAQFTDAAVDYASASNWVLLPEGEPKEVDLFYIYPTVFRSDNEPYMKWDSAQLRDKTVNISRQQTGPFAAVCNVYAPFVRQAELGRALEDFATEPLRGRSFQRGIEDTVEAFRYYLRHHNKGRPFILAGHSQGATDIFQLMASELQSPEVREKLIAAYLPGIVLTADDFARAPHLKIAANALDLGVVIVWNTQSPQVTNSVFTGRGGIGINLLNWRTDAVPAPAETNVGAVFFDGDNHMTAELPGFCGAKFNPETGALEVTPVFPGKYDSTLLGPGVYHMNDIYFFYRNIEVNARDRIARYFIMREK